LLTGEFKSIAACRPVARQRELDGRVTGVQFAAEARNFFLLSTAPRPPWGRFSLLPGRYLGAIFPIQSGKGVKLTTPSIAPVKNGGAITPHPLTFSWHCAYVIHEWKVLLACAS
jgi:hypothetical protein